MPVEGTSGTEELDFSELEDDADGFVDDTRGVCSSALKALWDYITGGGGDDC